ncbi:hypothetical protein D6855_09860 [Butyrivibrio sp. CB08]|uniref:hypothetical protein n=1 Tax=Butyrivibrio sp. CB08 TaxID=2364879 RepID=UPI000EAA08DE|nr:hypothetical protein [Butyrivibrio sp. CB08]RKM59202.1 hypothetical protein D6855_09860 [Butyrivibrio sp. CB08]
MRKRWIGAVLAVCVTLGVAGCGSSDDEASRDIQNSSSVDEVLFQKIEESEATLEDSEPVEEAAEEVSIILEEPASEALEPAAEPASEPASGSAKAEGVDVDLTVLSSTMVYSEVYNMMMKPDDYKGKVIKMKGQYVPYLDEATGNRYFACFISDATACCSQGIEFCLTEDYSFPDDYPEEGDTICVEGTFDTYIEDGGLYCTLRNARLVL